MHLRKLQIEAPDVLHRELMFALARARALIQGLSNASAILTVHALAPAEEVAVFERWLFEASNGEGRIVRNEPEQ